MTRPRTPVKPAGIFNRLYCEIACRPRCHRHIPPAAWAWAYRDHLAVAAGRARGTAVLLISEDLETFPQRPRLSSEEIMACSWPRRNLEQISLMMAGPCTARAQHLLGRRTRMKIRISLERRCPLRSGCRWRRWSSRCCLPCCNCRHLLCARHPLIAFQRIFRGGSQRLWP